MSGYHDSRCYTMQDTSGTPYGRSSQPRILLADDNTGILDHVTAMLRADYDIVGQVADGDSQINVGVGSAQVQQAVYLTVHQ